MKKREKKPYEEPTTSVMWLNVRLSLLAGSGGTNLGGYGDAIDEGDSGGWHNE